MSKMLIAAAAGFLMVPAAAYADDAAPIHFKQNGVDYTYTVETKGNVRIVRGSANNGLEPFKLVVSKTGVTGTFDGRNVDFSQREVVQSDLTNLASR
jgi:hypothetical protein